MPISCKKMCKLFLEIGYEIVHGGKGSHIKLKKKGCPTIIIPHHKELTKGMEYSLRKKLENEKKRFVKSLLNGILHEQMS